MFHSNHKPSQEKRLETLAARTEKLKRAIVAQLKRTPLVSMACERVGVSRPAYYKWRIHDRMFARAADISIESGRFGVNDLAESRLIRLVQSDDLKAIKFWLGHNHPMYSKREIHEHDVACERQSTEEKHAGWSLFRQIMNIKFPSKLTKLTTDETRQLLETDEADEAREEEEHEEMTKYDEDPEGV